MNADIPTQILHGRLTPHPDRNRADLVWPRADNDTGPTTPLTLRYAVVLLGVERPFLPTLTLDDWGNEIDGLGQYRWIHQNGDRFPRAELFGYEWQPRRGGWQKGQRFVRDLELTARYPTYVTVDPAEEGVGARVHRIGIAHTGVAAPQKIDEPPDNVPMPIHRAAVQWWLVPPGYTWTEAA